MHRLRAPFTSRTGRIVWALVASLSVVWVFAVYLAYYSVHKPLSLRVVMAMADRVAELTIWALLLLIASALGRRLLGGLRYDSPLEELIFITGSGLGLLSLAVLGLGLVGALNRWLLYALALVACATLLPDLKATIRLLCRLKRPSMSSVLDKLMVGYLLVVLCLAALACLTPPVAWDSQVYHLTGPKLFIEQGRIVGGIDIPYLGFPSLLETLFLAGMLLKSDIVAKLVHFSFGLLTVGLLYSFSRRYLQARLPWLSATIFLSSPSIVLVSTWAYVDLGLAFYTFAAFYAFVAWTRLRNSHWLVMTGVLSGFALGVKYTAVLTPIILGLLVIWESRRRGAGGTLRRLLLFWLPTTMAACPWFLKNWAFTGNPIYPFFFHGRYWDEYRTWWYSRWGTGLLREPLRLLIAPWEMTILGVEGKAGYEANIGPVLLAFLPLLVLLLLRKSAKHQSSAIVAYALTLCGALYVFWLWGVAQSELLRQTRLLFPLFPLLSILASYAVERFVVWDVRGFSPQRFLLMALAIALCLNALSFVVSFGSASPLPYLLGLETRNQFLARHLGDYYAALSFVNEELPPSSRVLFLWEPRSYYCQAHCLPDAILDKFKHLVYRFGDAETISQHLRADGTDYVLFHSAGFEQILAAGFDPITPNDVEVLRTLQDEYLEPVYQVSETYVVYRLR